MITRVLRSRILLGASSILIMSASVPAWADEPSTTNAADRTGSYAFDLLVLRPAGVLKTAIGGVLLIPAYPLSIASGSRDEIVSRLVADPAQDTFTRPLGDI